MPLGQVDWWPASARRDIIISMIVIMALQAGLPHPIPEAGNKPLPQRKCSDQRLWASGTRPACLLSPEPGLKLEHGEII